MANPSVPATPEFHRVRDLPRRRWTDGEAETLADLLTRELRTTFGRERLRPIQGIMIAEAFDAGGMLAGVSVGRGKTLPTFLIPTIMGVQRPLLLVPSNLVEKTNRDLAVWSYHFRVHPRIRVFSYERLSVVSGANALEQYNPDLIIADEVHNLKNRDSARGRRFLRYMQAHQDTKMVGLSGSITRRSLRDYWHILGLCLKETAPIPYVLHELETWAAAIDPDVDDRVRLAPGCLLDLAPEPADTGTPLDRARASYQRRLSETRGVVITPSNEIAASLEISARPLEAPAAVDDALESLRTTWETPNGDELLMAIDVWRHARELACGFWYQWNPPPPPEWLEARKAWHKFVRGMLGRNLSTMDSPLQVARRFADHPLHNAWRAVRDLYDPDAHKRAVWISDFLLRDAAGWLNDHTQAPGIAWVEHHAAGERLALLSGRSYFGGGPDASRAILDAHGPIIASIKAHGTGKNLQHYSRNLIVSVPPSADTIEQLLGRTHRDGQEADTVTVELYLHAPEIREGLARALSEADYIQRSTGMPQKLLYADKLFRLEDPAPARTVRAGQHRP